MVGIEGVGGVPDPKPNRVPNARPSSSPDKEPSAPTGDEVKVSTAAQAAARIVHLIKASNSEPDIRADRVEAAKAAIARGDYKNPDVVAKMAEDISKIL